MVSSSLQQHVRTAADANVVCLHVKTVYTPYPLANAVEAAQAASDRIVSVPKPRLPRYLANSLKKRDDAILTLERLETQLATRIAGFVPNTPYTFPEYVAKTWTKRAELKRLLLRPQSPYITALIDAVRKREYMHADLFGTSLQWRMLRAAIDRHDSDAKAAKNELACRGATARVAA
jgi:hypothetical protein